MAQQLIRAEEQLLVSCARSLVDRSTSRRIWGLLEHGIDWDSFLRTANYHRVLPLVWRSLSRHFGESVPKSVANELAHQCAAIARRNLYLTAGLREVVVRLGLDGVRVLAYKGPVSAVQAYGSLSLRQFGDLDILVDPTDYSRTRTLLQSLGWRATTDWGWECSFDDDLQSLRVDVHRNIAPDQFPVALDFAGLWERRESVPVAGGGIQTMHGDDALIILCIQLVKDCWGEGALRLSKVCDIAELIRSRSDVNWDFVTAQARRFGCLRMVQVSLGVTERLLGSLPGAIPLLQCLQPDRGPLEDRIITRLFGSSEGSASVPMTSAVFHFKMRERWSDKVYPYAHALALLMRPNERDRAMVSLRAPCEFLYYLIRPVRLARDHIRRFVSPRT